jgi:lysozyme
MTISDAGIDLIKRFEGCRLTAYYCPARVLTIGYGHTGQDVKPGMTITQQQADALLRRDLQRFERAVSESVKYPLTQPMYDALVSFAFNCGTAALKTSTLLRLLNQGDVQGAAAQFDRWTKGGGKVLPGLVRRRSAEKAMFLTPMAAGPA